MLDIVLIISLFFAILGVIYLYRKNVTLKKYEKEYFTTKSELDKLIDDHEKYKFTDYEHELMLFVIDMYLKFGESLDIFPNDDKKQVLLDRINELKEKVKKHGV